MKKGIKFAAALACLAAMCLSSAVAAPKKAKKSKQKAIKVGVIQLLEHVALDKNYQGFVDGLKELGYEDGKNIKIDFQNAQGEQANCVTIAEKLINDKDDLIFAIATPAAQAVANLTTTIPVVISSVTDPESAKLVKSNAMPGTNVTGTSDLTPCAAQMKLLKKIFPEAKTVGMLFCSSEQNSRFQIDLAEAACKELGLDYVEMTVSNSNELAQVTQALCGKCDVLYSPTDNMVAAGMALVGQVCLENKKAIICGEEGMVDAGGLATYGINYYELGKQTAKMAVEILKGKNPAEMPIQYLDVCDLKVNQATADALGIKIPADL